MMNMKQIVAAALLSSAVALPSVQAADSVFDGFYMGGKVTGESSKLKADTPIKADGFGSAGVGVGLFGGYRTLMDSFCIGGEASIRYASDKITIGTAPASIEFKRSYVAGAHLLVGTLVGQNLVAAKLGVEYAPYKVKAGSVETTKKKTAFNVGVLFEMPIADSLCLRAEGAVTPSVSIDNAKVAHQSYGAGLVYKIN